VALLVLTTATLVVLAGAALTHRTTQRIVPLTVMGAVLLVASVPLTKAIGADPLDHQVATGPGLGVWRLAVIIATIGSTRATIAISTGDPDRRSQPAQRRAPR
jgi:hypothetical protein